MNMRNSYIDDMRPNRRSNVVDLNFYNFTALTYYKLIADTGLPKRTIELYKIKCKIIWDADSAEVYTIDMNGEPI